MSWTNDSKSASSFTNEPRDAFVRVEDAPISLLESHTFEDTLLTDDGVKAIEDVAFDDLIDGTGYDNGGKSSTSFSNQTKN